MLDINIEFSRGVLFVRLSGNISSLNETNIKENILNILKEGGIKNLVFSIDNLNIIGNIKLFEECNKLISKNNGKMIICTKNKEMHLGEYKNVSDELSALRMINA